MGELIPKQFCSFLRDKEKLTIAFAVPFIVLQNIALPATAFKRAVCVLTFLTADIFQTFVLI